MGPRGLVSQRLVVLLAVGASSCLPGSAVLTEDGASKLAGLMALDAGGLSLLGSRPDD